MPTIKEFTAPVGYRVNDSGFSAFETMGRRVGGQYNEAANDIRTAGRVRGDITRMIGRWPFNIIELEQRAAEQATARSGGGAGLRTRGGGGGGRGGIPDPISDFPIERMPNLDALNQ